MVFFIVIGGVSYNDIVVECCGVGSIGNFCIFFGYCVYYFLEVFFCRVVYKFVVVDGEEMICCGNDVVWFFGFGF